MKKILKENDIRTAIQEAITDFVNEERDIENDYNIDDYDLSWQDVYSDALDRLEGDCTARTTNELIADLGYDTESLSPRNFAILDKACNDALEFHYGVDESKVRQVVNESVRSALTEGGVKCGIRVIEDMYMTLCKWENIECPIDGYDEFKVALENAIDALGNVIWHSKFGHPSPSRMLKRQ